MEKFTLINKARSRIKVFEPFEDSSKNSSMINAILISYGCVVKRSSKPVIKGSRVESIEEARNEYKKLLEEGWGKTYRFNSFLKKGEQVLYLKVDIIKDSDALESFFECITSCSINSEGVDSTTACYVEHLRPNNIDYP